MSARWRGDLLALAAGTAFPLAFSPFDLYPLALVSLGLLFALWRACGARRAFVRGALFGLGMFGVGVTWIYVSIHDFGHVGRPLALFLTALFVVVLALFPALAGWTAVRLGGARTRGVLLAYPAAWSLFEWVRGWFLGGFTWLQAGYSQIDAPLAGLAPLFGVYGISLATAASSALLLIAVSGREAALRGRCLTAAVALWAIGAAAAPIAWTRPDGAPLRVSLVQGNIAQDVKWHPATRGATLELYTALTRAHWDSELIVWPETALPIYYDEAGPFLEALRREAQAHDTELLVGLIYEEPETRAYFNSMVAVGAAGGFYHKRHLVPFTEFLPLKRVLAGVVDFMDVPMSDFSAGGADQPPLRVAGTTVGVSICYEDAFGEEVVAALPAAALLVNVSNDAWFGRSLAPAQHLQIARMRAAETGRPLLRATNTGISAVIGPHGGLQGAAAPQFAAYVLSAEVQPMGGLTPYARFGNAVAVAAIALLLVAGARRGLTRRFYRRER